MELGQGGLHVFSERTNLVVQAFYREAEYQRVHKEEWNVIRASWSDMDIGEWNGGREEFLTVIQYPHAVSCWKESIHLSFEYLVASYSKRRKAPVLFSVIGQRLEANQEEYQEFQMYWAVDGNYIAQYDVRSKGKTIITRKTEGLEILKEMLPLLDKKSSILYQEKEDILPLDLATGLEKELGIYLGREALGTILERCTLKKEHPFAQFYQSGLVK